MNPETVQVSSSVKPAERAKILNPLVRASFEDANARNESLALVRPQRIEITWVEKSPAELAREREKHAELASQMSFFDSTARPLEPCPIQFSAKWKDQDGKDRKHECDDWETSSAFHRFERGYGRSEAINILRKKYEQDYFKAGLLLAFSTHSRRNVTHGTNNQWLLVGIIRVNNSSQGDLFLG